MSAGRRMGVSGRLGVCRGTRHRFVGLTTGHLGRHSMSRCRVSEAISTATMVTSAIAITYDASAPRPYGSSAVAMNGESPPASTDESWDPSDAPL